MRGDADDVFLNRRWSLGGELSLGIPFGPEFGIGWGGGLLVVHLDRSCIRDKGHWVLDVEEAWSAPSRWDAVHVIPTAAVWIHWQSGSCIYGEGGVGWLIMLMGEGERRREAHSCYD